MAKKGREAQAYIRFGKFVISHIPLNIIVGELTVDGKTGKEKIKSNGRTYHINYEKALENLFHRMVADKVAQPQIDMVEALKQSMIDSVQEITEVLEQNPLNIAL